MSLPNQARSYTTNWSSRDAHRPNNIRRQTIAEERITSNNRADMDALSAEYKDLNVRFRQDYEGLSKANVHKEAAIRSSQSYSAIEDEVYISKQYTEGYSKLFCIQAIQADYRKFVDLKHYSGLQTNKDLFRFLVDFGLEKFNQLKQDAKNDDPADQLALKARSTLEQYGMTNALDRLSNREPPVIAVQKDSGVATVESLPNKEEDYTKLHILSCPKCGADHMTQDELEIHLLTCDILSKYRQPPSSVQKPLYLVCMWCSMRFSEQADLKRHVNVYHTNHKDYYVCHNCSKCKAYSDKEDLTRHQRSDPVCNDCRKHYSKLNTLNLHKKFNCRKSRQKQRAAQRKLAECRQKYLNKLQAELRASRSHTKTRDTPTREYKSEIQLSDQHEQEKTIPKRKCEEKKQQEEDVWWRSELPIPLPTRCRITEDFLTAMNFSTSREYLRVPPTNYRRGYTLKRDFVAEMINPKSTCPTKPC